MKQAFSVKVRRPVRTADGQWVPGEYDVDIVIDLDQLGALLQSKCVGKSRVTKLGAGSIVAKVSPGRVRFLPQFEGASATERQACAEAA